MTSRAHTLFSQLKFKSLTYVFLLADFVYISYLTHFAIASLVIFAELCILLCYEVFVLKFR